MKNAAVRCVQSLLVGRVNNDGLAERERGADLHMRSKSAWKKHDQYVSCADPFEFFYCNLRMTIRIFAVLGCPFIRAFPTASL